jgi:MFS family permease
MTTAFADRAGVAAQPPMTDPSVERETIRAVSIRLLPFLFVLYIFSYLDRTNVSIAALQMNKELNFSPTAYGFGAGIFFLGYALFEVPSNLILTRVGARRWIARIMVTWGLLACAMMLVRTPVQFYVTRFLLGVAEAGFFPGVVYYLGNWFPASHRARALSVFFIAIPLSSVLRGMIGGTLLGLSGVWHLSGWQWLFLVEGLPPVFLGLVVLAYLTERPEEATWLPTHQRDWLSRRLEQERELAAPAHVSPLRALGNPLVLILSIPYFAQYTVSLGYQLWGPTLVRDALGTSNSTTSLIIAGIFLYSALIYPLAAMLSDRWDERCAFPALGLAFMCTGCIGMALLPHSPFRVAALVLLATGSPTLLGSFWCLPTRFLKGPAAAAGIALIAGVGATGGFVGPYLIGLLKRTSGSDVGAFYGLAALALVGSFVCIGLRRTAVLQPRPRVIAVLSAAQQT